MRQNTLSLVGCLMLVGLIAFPSVAGITLRASRAPQPQGIRVTTYLADNNEALDRALEIHNLLNEMPSIRDMSRTSNNLKQQTDLFKEMQKNIASCNVKKLGKVFKDPDTVWSKMTSAYEKKRQTASKKMKQQDTFTMSIEERKQSELIGWNTNREIMMDVYANPEKWGAVNKGASFPLWKDQISLFEKEWNQFYEDLNATYGAPLKGRPAVDEETRHNSEKYDAVLAAHKAYLSQISKGRRPADSKVAKGKPPKAPKALPDWQEIVRVDPKTGKVTPELPEPWKKMSDNKFKDYSSDGEMAQVFSGKSLTPNQGIPSTEKSDLETDYDMMLAIDALDKGTEGSFDTQKKIAQPFAEKLAKLGIDTTDFNISDRAQYARIQKELKELKKKAIKEAYAYMEKLENQDKTNPSYVARRNRLKEQKRARLSAEAQAATAGISDTLQISQMSPVMQQRLTLSALEKDEGASVYLTQTNALNVDQLMREQKSTDKIVAESYQQVETVMEKQQGAMPQMAECHF